jgi:DNA-binding NarL/FixJ family response regulator
VNDRPKVTVALRCAGSAAMASALAAHGLEVVDEDPTVVVLPDDLQVVAQQTGSAKVVVLADAPDRRRTTVLLDLGVAGIVSGHEDPARLAAAIRAVAADLLVLPSDARTAVRRPVLTARQKQVLGLVTMGLSNAEIATRLILSEKTVKAHLTAVFAQLGVRSRKEAVDLIYDPTSGLGAGILGIPEASRVRQTYARPKVDRG